MSVLREIGGSSVRRSRAGKRVVLAPWSWSAARSASGVPPVSGVLRNSWLASVILLFLPVCVCQHLESSAALYARLIAGVPLGLQEQAGRTRREPPHDGHTRPREPPSIGRVVLVGRCTGHRVRPRLNASDAQPAWQGRRIPCAEGHVCARARPVSGTHASVLGCLALSADQSSAR